MTKAEIELMFLNYTTKITQEEIHGKTISIKYVNRNESYPDIIFKAGADRVQYSINGETSSVVLKAVAERQEEISKEKGWLYAE